MLFPNIRRSIAILLTGIVVATAGCSRGDRPELVSVEGQVTLNGEPLVGAEVVFRPDAKGRPSIGKTDMDGKYKLLYLPGEWGAIRSKHKVTISTRVDPDSDSDDPFAQKGRKELVPPRYNKDSTLEADLTSGTATELNFPLEGAQSSS